MREDKTSIEVLFDELGAGTFKPLFEQICSKVSLATMVHGSEKASGSIKIDLTFSRTSETEQLGMSYKLSHSLPTHKGKRSEETRGASAFFVAKGGKLCVEAPEQIWNGQQEMFSDDG